MASPLPLPQDPGTPNLVEVLSEGTLKQRTCWDTSRIEGLVSSEKYGRSGGRWTKPKHGCPESLLWQQVPLRRPGSCRQGHSCRLTLVHHPSGPETSELITLTQRPPHRSPSHGRSHCRSHLPCSGRRLDRPDPSARGAGPSPEEQALSGPESQVGLSGY